MRLPSVPQYRASGLQVTNLGPPAGPKVPVGFVNAGAFQEITASSLAVSLPASRTNNNILLAFCRSGVLTSFLTCTTPGWNKVYNVFDAANNCFAALYYCPVTGSEIAPVFNISTPDFIEGQMVQYTGVDSPPIGAISQTGGKDVFTISVPGLTTTRSNSVVVWCTMCVGTQPSPIPTGFTARFTDTGPEAWADQLVPTSGTTIGTASVTYTIPVGNWDGFMIELLTA